MLQHLPAGISPRYSCHPDNYAHIALALNTVGHVVIENVFDTTTLHYSKAYTLNFFKKMDAAYQQEQLSETECQSYFGNTYSFMPDKEGNECFQLFMDMIGRSIINLYFYLLKGDVAAIHGPILRRVDPTFPLRCIGLHVDNQKPIIEYTNQAFRCKDAYSMWTPLCDINSNTPGLLLLHRKFRFINTAHNLLEPGDVNNVHIYNTDAENLNEKINVTPLYLFNLPRKELNPNEDLRINTLQQETLDSLIKKLGYDIYAPQLTLGSAIIFNRDVIHGSFSYNGLTQPRHSIDLRFIGDFDKLKEYAHKERSYIFKQYSAQSYDPNPTLDIPPFISLENQVIELQKQVAQQHQELKNYKNILQVHHQQIQTLDNQRIRAKLRKFELLKKIQKKFIKQPKNITC